MFWILFHKRRLKIYNVQLHLLSVIFSFISYLFKWISAPKKAHKIWCSVRITHWWLEVNCSVSTFIRGDHSALKHSDIGSHHPCKLTLRYHDLFTLWTPSLYSIASVPSINTKKWQNVGIFFLPPSISKGNVFTGICPVHDTLGLVRKEGLPPLRKDQPQLNRLGNSTIHQ